MTASSFVTQSPNTSDKTLGNHLALMTAPAVGAIALTKTVATPRAHSPFHMSQCLNLSGCLAVSTVSAF